MNVLFVCSGNIGRSQMAMEYFKQLGVGKTASAGTRVTIEDERIGDRDDAQIVLEAMREDGIEMSSNTRIRYYPKHLTISIKSSLWQSQTEHQTGSVTVQSLNTGRFLM